MSLVPSYGSLATNSFVDLEHGFDRTALRSAPPSSDEDNDDDTDRTSTPVRYLLPCRQGISPPPALKQHRRRRSSRLTDEEERTKKNKKWTKTVTAALNDFNEEFAPVQAYDSSEDAAASLESSSSSSLFYSPPSSSSLFRPITIGRCRPMSIEIPKKNNEEEETPLLPCPPTTPVEFDTLSWFQVTYAFYPSNESSLDSKHMDIGIHILLSDRRCLRLFRFRDCISLSVDEVDKVFDVLQVIYANRKLSFPYAAADGLVPRIPDTPNCTMTVNYLDDLSLHDAMVHIDRQPRKAVASQEHFFAAMRMFLFPIMSTNAQDIYSPSSTLESQ
jgi:hypothetical protein